MREYADTLRIAAYGIAAFMGMYLGTYYVFLR